MKRIINGVTFDTETGTEVFSEHPNPEWSDAWWGLYQSRHGVFFKVVCDHDGTHTFTPLTDDEARLLLEERANHLVEQCFSLLPEYGVAERRLTIRIPGSLARRVETAAATQGVTINRYVMRSLEKSVSQDPGSAR